MTTAVIVIDMIKDFVTGKFENERAERIIPHVKELLMSARSQNVPVIYVSDSHPEEDNEFSIWGPHAVSGTEGSEVIPELEPKNSDYTLEKQKYSAFYGTELESLLKKLDVDELVLSGVLTHICIQHTAADAFYRGYDVIIPRGCVEDLSDDRNEESFEFMKENYGARIVDFKDLVGEW
ncbi:hypothetical protein AKJ41_03885 [candidate division MSBL1 archaeon SCGC-AAA259O05]|uniref:Isochorismatase-like domain-containing protein n=1 Tax=candidate division MSBL1 archaeon SCGC-AAA259O05 TaxID=1698271 RepID=A0A133V2H8_9EURY|nr:hypothetical protein AKJ41_03885 [candidate division MSBL1 archaeon SCGC-AAA259O05]